MRGRVVLLALAALSFVVFATGASAQDAPADLPDSFAGAASRTTTVIGGVTGSAANPPTIAGGGGNTAVDIDARQAIQNIMAKLKAHGIS